MAYYVSKPGTERIERILFNNEHKEEEGAYAFYEEYFMLFDENGEEIAVGYQDIDELIEVLNTVKRFKAEGKI